MNNHTLSAIAGIDVAIESTEMAFSARVINGCILLNVKTLFDLAKVMKRSPDAYEKTFGRKSRNEINKQLPPALVEMICTYNVSAN